MRPGLPAPARDERGFILVGVVMFMLALTILGLSLFALSSYEAQFFYASAAREQSLQRSESGMELVKAQMDTWQPRLEYAHRAEGQYGIVEALAYQQRSPVVTDTTSRGPVDMASPIWIVVKARSGGVERTLQAEFVPTPMDNPYHRIVACGAALTCNLSVTSDRDKMRMEGDVWQPVRTAADTLWTEQVTWTSSTPILQGAPPTPLADDFVDEHLETAEDPEHDYEEDRYVISFEEDRGEPVPYRSPPKPTKNDEDKHDAYRDYEYYTEAELTLEVFGTAVWVIGDGACFRELVKVRPHRDLREGDTATLVIVAKANPDHVGLWFKDGLEIDDRVRVFIVSQGNIAITHRGDNSGDHVARGLSIVAGGSVEVGGPRSGYQLLGHDAPDMNAIASRLLAQRWLPSLDGGSGMTFAIVPKTWLETTPR